MYQNSHSEGICVLLEIPSMHKLVQYFQTLLRNEDIYELKGVHIAKPRSYARIWRETTHPRKFGIHL